MRRRRGRRDGERRGAARADAGRRRGGRREPRGRALLRAGGHVAQACAAAALAADGDRRMEPARRGRAMLPIALAFPMPGPVTPRSSRTSRALALLCSAVAYLLYFRLIRDIGPTRAMTVTFLMPALGMLWGALFLGETVTLAMLGGAALVVAGTARCCVPRASRARRRPRASHGSSRDARAANRATTPPMPLDPATSPTTSPASPPTCRRSRSRRRRRAGMRMELDRAPLSRAGGCDRARRRVDRAARPRGRGAHLPSARRHAAGDRLPARRRLGGGQPRRRTTAPARRSRSDADAVVASVHYRRAPESPYPAPNDDAYAALAWLAEHAGALDIDAAALGVGGDSAGAHLALRLRDRGARPRRVRASRSSSWSTRSVEPAFDTPSLPRARDLADAHARRHDVVLVAVPAGGR